MMMKSLALLMVLLAMGISWPVFAIDPSQFFHAPGTDKVAYLWDKKLQYRVIYSQDPSDFFDGASFREPDTNKKFIIFNKAFLEKEAHKIFEKFAKNSTLQTPPSEEQLKELEKALLQKKALGQLTAVSKNLEALNEWLEQMTWHSLYVAAVSGSKSPSQAFKKFAAQFMELRIKNLELHEGAHLLDVDQFPKKEKQSSVKGQAFTRWSELNAFYTELSYGPIPQDVMANAVRGLIEEMEVKESIDYSWEKILAVLCFMKTNLSQSLAPGAISPCCLQQWLHMSRSDFASVGTELYHSRKSILPYF